MKNLLDLAMGAIVVAMKHYHKEDQVTMHVPSCSYHFHFLVFKDKKHSNLSLLCLDNDELMSSKAMGFEIGSIERKENMQPCLDKMLEMMMESWYKKEHIFYDNNVNLEKVFEHKSPQIYWDKFNEIKEKSYSHRRKTYLDYVSEYKSRMIKEQIKKEEDTNELAPLMYKRDNEFISEAYKNEEHLITT